MSSGPGDTVLEVAGLRVGFWLRDDRFAHAIWSLDGESPTLLLSSREGTHADDWPPSPPLQELSVLRRTDDLQVATLVGMAGGSHWSAAVTLRSDASVEFDIACRFSAAPKWLGSRYALGPGVAWNTSTETIESPRGRWQVASLELDPVEIVAEDGGVRVAVVLREAPPPATVRWGYRLAPADAPASGWG